MRHDENTSLFVVRVCLLFLYTVFYRLRREGKVTSLTRFNEVSSVTLSTVLH